MDILLNKIPESPEERKALIGEFIRKQEELFANCIGYIQRLVIENLIERGYSPDDMEINKSYEVSVSEREKFSTSVDLIIRINEKAVLAIKCAYASIDSWQRFMLSFCRVVEPFQIPYAFITDGHEGRIIDILSGEVRETMDIPSKEDLIKLFPSLSFIPYSEEKLPREKRILYAFDAIKCCPTYNI